MQQKTELMQQIQLAGNDKYNSDVVAAIFTPAICEIKEKDALKWLIEKIGNWRFKLGLTKDQDPNQTINEAKYMLEHFPDNTLLEFDAAINLLCEHRLDFNMPYVPIFSPLLISQIMAAYRKYKVALIEDLKEKANKAEYSKSEERTAAQKVEDMRELIRMCKKHIEEDDNYSLICDDVYNYLHATKKMLFNKESIEAAKEYGKKRVIEYKAKKDKTIGDLLHGLEKDKTQYARLEKKFARQYCLIKHFKDFPLEAILNSVSEKEYVKK